MLNDFELFLETVKESLEEIETVLVNDFNEYTDNVGSKWNVNQGEKQEFLNLIKEIISGLTQNKCGQCGGGNQVRPVGDWECIYGQNKPSSASVNKFGKPEL